MMILSHEEIIEDNVMNNEQPFIHGSPVVAMYENYKKPKEIGLLIISHDG